MVAWTQAAILDPTVFPRPGLLRPDRPGGTYLHFGGGLHPCAGRAVNAFQIPLLVGALLRRAQPCDSGRRRAAALGMAPSGA